MYFYIFIFDRFVFILFVVSFENGGVVVVGIFKMLILVLGVKVNFFDVDLKDRMLKFDILWMKLKL